MKLIWSWIFLVCAAWAFAQPSPQFTGKVKSFTGGLNYIVRDGEMIPLSLGLDVELGDQLRVDGGYKVKLDITVVKGGTQTGAIIEVQSIGTTDGIVWIRDGDATELGLGFEDQVFLEPMSSNLRIRVNEAYSGTKRHRSKTDVFAILLLTKLKNRYTAAEGTLYEIEASLAPGGATRYDICVGTPAGQPTNSSHKVYVGWLLLNDLNKEITLTPGKCTHFIEWQTPVPMYSRANPNLALWGAQNVPIKRRRP